MSTLVFPAGLCINVKNVNLEKMEFYSRAWNLHRRQMQKGFFIGSIITAHTPRMQLTHCPYSHGVLLQGDFPKGSILIACVITESNVTFQNSSALNNEIKILKSGDEIDFLCTGQSDIFTLAVEEEFFYKSYESYFGIDFYNHQKEKEIYLEPNLVTHYINGLQKYLTYLMQISTTNKLQNSYASIEEELLKHVFSSIYLEVKEKKRQKFNVSRARTLLHNSIEDNYSISDIAKSCNISERLLFYTFKKNYGTTPKNYLNSLRFNNIREELLNINKGTVISDIIGKYHFYNQSTFTQAYKHMFGELPSQTLKQ